MLYKIWFDNSKVLVWQMFFKTFSQLRLSVRRKYCHSHCSSTPYSNVIFLLDCNIFKYFDILYLTGHGAYHFRIFPKCLWYISIKSFVLLKYFWLSGPPDSLDYKGRMFSLFDYNFCMFLVNGLVIVVRGINYNYQLFSCFLPQC